MLGVLAGGDMPLDLLRKWADSADVVFAADGGANRLCETGFVAAEVIGDLDSINPEVVASGSRVSEDPSQEFTDCDKMLRLIQQRGHASVTLASLEGNLPDHAIASLQSAARSPLDIQIAYRRGIGWILKPGWKAEAPAKSNRRVSLLPLTACTGVRLTGVQWPLDDVTLDPQGLSSISNRAIGDRVTASLRTGVAFLFLEYPPEEMPAW